MFFQPLRFIRSVRQLEDQMLDTIDDLLVASDYHFGRRETNGFFVVAAVAVFPGLQTTDALFAFT